MLNKYKSLKIIDVIFLKITDDTAVVVKLPSKEVIDLIFFIEGEVNFSREELIGLTVSEALDFMRGLYRVSLSKNVK